MSAVKAGRLIAREYARVLFALPADEREAVGAYFQRLHEQAAGTSDVRNFLGHPAIADDEKVSSLEETAPRRFSPVVGRVLADIVRRRMAVLFSAIAAELRKMSDEEARVHRVAVTSALPLSEPQRLKLIARLQDYCGGKVQVQFAVDRALMAGFSLQTGATVLDNSLRTDLGKIRRQLMAVSST